MNGLYVERGSGEIYVATSEVLEYTFLVMGQDFVKLPLCPVVVPLILLVCGSLSA